MGWLRRGTFFEAHRRLKTAAANTVYFQLVLSTFPLAWWHDRNFVRLEYVLRHGARLRDEGRLQIEPLAATAQRLTMPRPMVASRSILRLAVSAHSDDNLPRRKCA
jgi:hypothetical protein